MTRTRISIHGAAEGAARKWGMPRLLDNTPRCKVVVDWPKCVDGGLRHDLEAIAFAEYIVGADPSRPSGTGRGLPALVKGRAGQPVAMFGSHPEIVDDSDFARRWLKGDPALGGQDRRRWNIQQAWHVHTLRRPLRARNYRRSPLEQHQFRIRLLPDPVVGVPLAESDRMEELTRRFMAGVEEDFAQETKSPASFVWIAAAHYNVDHPHVHIGVRGITVPPDVFVGKRASDVLVGQDHIFFNQKYLRPSVAELKADPCASGPIDKRARNVLAEMMATQKVRYAG